MNDIFKWKTVRDIDLAKKKVLLRVDFNVPLEPTEPPTVSDDARIKESMPTIEYLLEQGATLICVAHLGRPKGKVIEALKMKPVAERFAEIISERAYVTETKLGDFPAYKITDKVFLLENIRFYPEEEKNDAKFSKKLAALADVYVDDAFGTVHRAHASTVGVTKFLPAVSGLLLEKEIVTLSRLMVEPARPFVAVQGGIKVSTKIGIIRRLLDLVDYLLIGSGLTSTFLKAQGYDVGASKIEEEAMDMATQVLEKARTMSQNMILPVDLIVADAPTEDAKIKVVDIPAEPGVVCEAPFMILDIGPKTVKLFEEKIKEAKSVFWNGPLGFNEVKPFAKGSKAIAEAIGRSGAVSVVGGGDIVAFLDEYGLNVLFTHVSTGGGASLEFVAGDKLPGVEALQKK